MTARLAELLTSSPPDPLPTDADLLIASGTAAWVASRLLPGHPVGPLLEGTKRRMLGRQMVIRRSLSTLLQAWNEARVASVLIKGFALAEFAYRVPGTRAYGDVDILVRPEHLEQLVRVALQQGWTDDGYSGRPAEWTHEIAHLYSPEGEIRLDVHRYAIPWIGGPVRTASRITDAVWQDSVPEQMEGAEVRRPSWPDCALILVLGRSWSADQARYKPADYTDLAELAARPGMTEAQMEVRARALGAHHTWRAFAAGCAPWSARFDFPSPGRSRTICLATLRDGAQFMPMLTLLRVRRSPAVVLQMLRAVPDVMAVWIQLRRHQRGTGRAGLLSGMPTDAARRLPDPRDLVKQLAPVRPPSRPSPQPGTIFGLLRGVRLLTQLVYPRSHGVCVPRSLASYRALSRRGVAVVYVSGVRRGVQGNIEGHAWVEGPEGPLEGYSEPNNRWLYNVVFEDRNAISTD